MGGGGLGDRILRFDWSWAGEPDYTNLYILSIPHNRSLLSNDCYRGLHEGGAAAVSGRSCKLHFPVVTQFFFKWQAQETKENNSIMNKYTGSTCCSSCKYTYFIHQMIETLTNVPWSQRIRRSEWDPVLSVVWNYTPPPESFIPEHRETGTSRNCTPRIHNDLGVESAPKNMFFIVLLAAHTMPDSFTWKKQSIAAL